jgi:hypothetical protein
MEASQRTPELAGVRSTNDMGKKAVRPLLEAYLFDHCVVAERLQRLQS